MQNQFSNGEEIYIKEGSETAYNCADIIGDCPCIQKIFRLVQLDSGSDSTVLILPLPRLP